VPRGLSAGAEPSLGRLERAASLRVAGLSGTLPRGSLLGGLAAAVFATTATTCAAAACAVAGQVAGHTRFTPRSTCCCHSDPNPNGDKRNGDEDGGETTADYRVVP
jgi:hypothetical protein